MNKLKLISIAICCTVIALWSETQGMEKQTYILEEPLVKAGSTIQLSAQHVNAEFKSDPISTSLVNLEDATTSWSTCWLSPAKSAIQSAYDIMNFTTQHPQKALIVGLCLSYQFFSTAAAIANISNCHCTFENGLETVFPIYCRDGHSFNVTVCNELCAAMDKWVFHGCN